MENTTAKRVHNILSLADRVQVIREYEKDSQLLKPNFQRLATKFGCSTKQIRNIIHSSDTILKSYQEGDENDDEGTNDQALHKRQEKIDFLGKVIYEYIQRILCLNYPIDEDKVRQKALEIKDCIVIKNFQPNTDWFKNFKMTYGIPDFNPETLRNKVSLKANKRADLSAIDMIQFVSRQEQKASKLDVNVDQRKRGRSSRIEKLQQKNHNLLEPTVVNEAINDDDDDDEVVHNDNLRTNGHEADLTHDADDDDDFQLIPLYGHNNNNNKNICEKTNIQNSYQSHKPLLLSSSPPPLRRFRTNAPLSNIGSPKEALKHIKCVGKHAMPQDNFKPSVSSSSPPPLKRFRSNAPLSDIRSPEEALKHIKCLEEYAMLQDNFIAIILLTKLEQIFVKNLKRP